MINANIKSVFRALLKEEESFLLETWSHYEEIDSAIDYIYTAIGNVARNTRDKTIVKGRIYLRSGETHVNVFKRELKLVFHMYIATDKEAADYMIKHCYAQNGLSADQKTLVLTIYTIMGNLLEPVSNKNVAHELKHILQISKGFENNVNYTSIADLSYEHSSTILSNSGSHTQTEINIAWLYYYSNPHEQDAFMGEYYKELCYGNQYILDKNSETHERQRHFENLLAWYNSNKTNPEVVEAISQYRVFGMPKRNFEAMINKSYKRFLKKMKSIEKHFSEKAQYLKENKFHHGLTHGTGSLYFFKLNKI